MPSGALSGDMVLETEDGEAHLVHSLFVERLSPSLLGPKVAAARAQYGPGAHIPGSSAFPLDCLYVQEEPALVQACGMAPSRGHVYVCCQLVLHRMQCLILQAGAKTG